MRRGCKIWDCSYAEPRPLPMQSRDKASKTQPRQPNCKWTSLMTNHWQSSTKTFDVMEVLQNHYMQLASKKRTKGKQAEHIEQEVKPIDMREGMREQRVPTGLSVQHKVALHEGGAFEVATRAVPAPGAKHHQVRHQHGVDGSRSLQEGWHAVLEKIVNGLIPTLPPWRLLVRIGRTAAI